METFRPPVFENLPASFPRYTFSIPLVTHLPALQPNNKLKQPEVPSRTMPASVPASKFSSASAKNPPEIKTVAVPAAPLVAVTVTPFEPLKSIVEILPPVPTIDPL